MLEFLHRIVDAFEDFVGAPLLAVKLENNYDVVAQLLTEMCDAGTVSTTEPNALREVVEMEGWVDKLLGSINLPGYEQTCNTSTNNGYAFSRLTLEQENPTQHKFKHTVPDSLQHAGAALETGQRTAHVKRALRRCRRNPFRHACSFREAFGCICQWDNCIYVKGVRRSRCSGNPKQSVRET